MMLSQALRYVARARAVGRMRKTPRQTAESPLSSSVKAEDKNRGAVGYVCEPLREDQDFLLYEGRPKQSEAAPVLLLASVSTRSELESLKKIEHEYSFRAELEVT